MASITKVRNKTATDIPALGLLANETKVIFYNRAFFLKKAAICDALFNDQIVFIDDENTVIVKKNPDYIKVVDDQYTNPYVLNELFLKFVDRWTGEDEEIESLEEEAGKKILIAIKSLRKKLVREGTISNYSKAALLTSLGSVINYLITGDITSASTAIGAIPNDTFWTTARRNRFKALCDNIDLT